MSIESIIIIMVNILLAVFLAVGLTPVFVWWERRVSGFMQDRSGPNRCNIGPLRLGGLIQSIADMLKLAFIANSTKPPETGSFRVVVAVRCVASSSFERSDTR